MKEGHVDGINCVDEKRRVMSTLSFESIVRPGIHQDTEEGAAK